MLDDRGALSEIDAVRLRREAVALYESLSLLNDDPYDLVRSCAPFISAALERVPCFPVRSAPLAITRMEDAGVVFPEGFIAAYCAFFMTAQGYRFDDNKVERRGDDDGAWVCFELEND